MSAFLRRIPGIGEIGAGLSRRDCPPHFHETYAISIFHERAVIHCRGRRHVLRPGALAVLDPREVHWGEPSPRGLAQAGILPAPELITQLFGRPEPVTFEREIVDDRLLVRWLLDGIDEPSRLPAAIRRLFEEYGTPVAPGARTAPVDADAETWLHQPIAALSEAAQISRSHYSRRFLARVGLSPVDFRRQERVRAARALIERGTPLSTAAAEAGFADQSHMTRQMRSILGVSPGVLSEGAGRNRSAGRSRRRGSGG